MMVDNTFTSRPPPLPAMPSRHAAPSPGAPAQGMRASSSSASQSEKGNRWLHAALFLLFVAGAGALALRGWEFYSLSLGERVDHADFRTLSPGNSWGRWYGIAASVLFLTNLSYLLRRRFARLSVGSLKSWLDVHVFTGLFGGLLVVFHSAFQARSPAALVTLVSMAVVLVTGIIGRWLYSLSPRGRAEDWQRATADLDVCVPGLGGALRSQLQALPLTAAPRRPSFIRSLLTLPRWHSEARRRAALVHDLCRRVLHAAPGEATLLEPTIRRCSRAARSQATTVAATAFLDSWRGLHRLSALLMTLVVLMHIGIAWYYGFASLG